MVKRAEAIIEWTEIDPQVAADNGLCCVEGSPIQGPINELDEECPWPWEPQQLKDAPIGQYHCPYCGGMVLAGMDHLDYANTPLGESYENWARA